MIIRSDRDIEEYLRSEDMKAISAVEIGEEVVFNPKHENTHPVFCIGKIVKKNRITAWIETDNGEKIKIRGSYIDKKKCFDHPPDGGFTYTLADVVPFTGMEKRRSYI